MMANIKWLAMAGLVLTAGCANVPRDVGFGSVQNSVMDRTGHRVYWNKGTEADKEVAEVLDSLLQRELTPDSAVQIALLNNQNLQATYEDLGVAQAGLVEAGLLKNPTLSAEVRFPERPKLPFEIDVIGDFLDLFFLPLRKRAAGAEFEAAKLRVTDAVLSMAAQTKGAFYRTQAAQQLIEMRRNIASATEASFEAAKKLHDAGNITDLALANEQALHEQAKIDLARAEAEALDVREELNSLMGVWGKNTDWKIAPRLPELPVSDIEPTGLESLAVSNRFDLAAVRRDVEAAAQRLGLTRSSAMIPEANASFHVSREPDGTQTMGPGIEVPLPIFNQGQGAIATAQARLRQSQRRYAALAVEIRSQVRRARNQMSAARDRAEYYQQVILPLRHQIVQQTQLQYNAMFVGVFQLLAAKKEEIDAGREYVEALREYWTARAELERAVGGSLRARMAATQSVASQPATQPDAAEQHQHHH
jgi:cobalt-zinc-cadmium efflux system outer membrane protein